MQTIRLATSSPFDSSGTEPKIKFYMFAFEPAEMLGDLKETETMLKDRMKIWETELAAFSKV